MPTTRRLARVAGLFQPILIVIGPAPGGRYKNGRPSELGRPLCVASD